MVVLDDGLVIGADPDGSRYDGTYLHNPTANTLECDITVMLAPGSWAVTRATAGTEWAPFKLKITIPRGPFTDYVHVASTPAGKINLLLSKLREFAASERCPVPVRSVAARCRQSLNHC